VAFFFIKNTHMKKYNYLLIILISFKLTAQNTVGTVMNTNKAYDGYTLFAPLASKKTYLINNCGEIVHQWTSTYKPSASVYLLENGNLLKTGKVPNTSITFGGAGGHVELFDWDNNLLWEYMYSSPEFTQNHDVYPLPNGNVLMLAITTMTKDEAIAEGRDPSLILENKVYIPKIVELEPIIGTDTANIVWEWNMKDHLIQNIDSTKDNFGVIKNNPGLLDFNFLHEELGNANWLHINSLQYNEELDQLIISSRLLSEIYIIDHSTTTEEAALHSGGTYEKGGDFLYRWGNPASHDMGNENDRTLYSQHYPHWIADGLVDAGKLLIFNNGNSRKFSSIEMVSPTTTADGVYAFDATLGYGPAVSEWTYTDPIDNENFFSSILSSAQRLPNGNMLICDGDSGYFFELDSTNTIVWEYINPDTANGIKSQGDAPSANYVFRALKFPKEYAAFTDKNLTAGTTVEINGNSCDALGLNTMEVSSTLNIYPNPTSDNISISTALTIDKIEIYNILGKLQKVKIENKNIFLSNSATGIYFIKIYSGDTIITKKIIKI